jgi:hypothetical protein
MNSRKLAALMRGGAMPQAIQMTHHQYSRDSPGKRIAYASNRNGPRQQLSLNAAGRSRRNHSAPAARADNGRVPT